MLARLLTTSSGRLRAEQQLLTLRRMASATSGTRLEINANIIRLHYGSKTYMKRMPAYDDVCRRRSFEYANLVAWVGGDMRTGEVRTTHMSPQILSYSYRIPQYVRRS